MRLGARPISSFASRKAAATGLSSSGSILPPGNDTWPAWLARSWVRTVNRTVGSLRSIIGTSTAAGLAAVTPAASHIEGLRSRSPRAPSAIGSRSDSGTSNVSRARARSKKSSPAPARADAAWSRKFPHLFRRRHGKEGAHGSYAKHGFALKLALLAELDEVEEQRARHFRPQIAAHVQIRLKPLRPAFRLEAQGMRRSALHPVIDISPEVKDPPGG